jgi:RHS repeat-associated protein
VAALRTRARPTHRCRRHVGLKLDSKTKKWVPKENYDANGNQTTNSAGQQLVYNSADQTTSMRKTSSSTALSAEYAGANQVQRYGAGADTFTTNLLGVGVLTNSAGANTSYVRDNAGGLVGLRDTARSYYLFDGLGSVVAVTNDAGTVVNRYSYDPYGVTTETRYTGAKTNPWRYTGAYFDTTTGLYKMGARYYQPELGRWTQPDSVFGELPYAYAGDNPVNFTDPTGLYCITGTRSGPGGGCRGGSINDQTQSGGPTASEALRDCAYGATGGFVFGGPPGAVGGCILANLHTAAQELEARDAPPF